MIAYGFDAAKTEAESTELRVLWVIAIRLTSATALAPLTSVNLPYV